MNDTHRAEDESNRLIEVTLDPDTIGAGNRDIEHERQVAIYDLLEDNRFAPVDHEGGPYCLKLLLANERLVFDVRRPDGSPVVAHYLSLTPFRRIVKDYFMMCESYHHAIRTQTPSQIEAIDVGRRGLHNEGSELLTARLKDKIEIDFDTARRLFTLITVLHWRG
ncbi:hypothetical protein A33M_0875 [Rhodovulum sp. PH10]|uniref:UPF0262 family protein n=1 Tax=Rhodovulum sp. PH10 TaxID=1187851 RepID=UPI00027C2E76|nr:UPF0262 family protein [Rhodovulum sp. PH10]EJW09856.1 hypothetical protein A33M_0875 [Rhodovulum sp. PH10]